VLNILTVTARSVRFCALILSALAGTVHAAPFAYIPNSLDNTVSVIDTVTNNVIATVPVGVQPYGVAVNPAGTRVYVTNVGSASVSVIDTATNTVVATVSLLGHVGANVPYGIAINPAGTRAYVTSRFHTVMVIDTVSNTFVTAVEVVAFDSPEQLGDSVSVSPDGTRVYVGTSYFNIKVIDTASNALADTVPVGGAPTAIGVNLTGSRLYVALYNNGVVVAIDTATSAVIDTVPVGRNPFAIGPFIGGIFGAPSAPIIVSATPGNGQATIAFTPPLSNGGSPITGYTATCNPGAFSISGPASPLVVTGLANGTTYACSVSATNANGTGPASDTLNVTPPGAFTSSSAVSRKVHGSAGTFDLPLSLLDAHNPTTEPRQGPSHTIVFTFDRAIASATATVTEGLATAGTPTFVGNNVVVPLTGVIDAQYVTIALTDVVASDASTGGSGSARVGFLAGDVNQNRVVTLADLGLVNAQLAQSVMLSNFLKDVNASGTLSLADKGITNSRLTKSLPAP